MAIKLGEALVAITGNRDQYKQELQKGEQDARSFGSSVGRILETGVGVALGNLALRITRELGEAFKTALTSGFDLGSMYDEVADKITIATGAQGAELAGLQGSFKKVFAAVPADIGTVSDALVALNQRIGLTDESLELAAIPMAEFSRLTGTDAATNVQVLSRLMGDWGVSIDDTVITLDKLFKAQQLTGASMQAIARASVQYGAIMRQMGFTLDESIALFGKWEQEGVNAELVMGSLRIAASEFAREGVPLAEGLRAVQEQIRNTTDASEALNIAIEVFGARAGPDMAAAIREGRFEIEDLVAVLQDAEGAILDTASATDDWPELVARAAHRITNALEPIGEAFLDIANTVAEHVLPVIEGMAEAVIPALEGVAGQAGTWGENIAIQLANGIAAAAPYVIGAIQAIADVITMWMAPGSPPRMLPDLPEWGASAMQEFLDGFGMADFSVLKDFSRTVEDLLQVKVAGGEMAEGDLVPALLGSRSGLAEALTMLRETGDVSDDVYARIREAAGVAGEEVERFARLYVDSQRVEIAEAEKSKIASEYSVKLSDARKRGASKSELDAIKAVRKEALATANERIRAAKGVDAAATDELSLEKLRLQAIADERDLYDQQIRTLGDFARGVASLSGAKDALKAITDKATDAEWNYRFAIADTAGKIDLLKEKLAGTIEGSEDYWQVKQQLAMWEQRHADEMKGGAGAASTLKDSLDDLIDTYRNLGKAQSDVSDGLHPALELLGPEYVGEEKNPWVNLFDMDAIKVKAEEVRKTITDALMPEGEGGGVQWSALGTKIAGPLIEALGNEVRQKASSSLFGGDEDKTWGDIGKELGRRVGNGIIEGIKETLPPGVQKLDLAFESWFGDGEETPEAPKATGSDQDETLGLPPAATKGPTALERVWGGVTSWFEGIKSDLDSAFDSLIDKSDDADTSVSDLATNAETNLTTMSSGVAQHMQTTSDDWAAKWALIDETHELTWKDILQAAADGGIQLGADILSNVNNILALMQGKEPDWQTRGQGMMTSAAAGADEKQQTLIDSIVGPVEEAMRQIEELWKDWTPPWDNDKPPTTPPPGGSAPPEYATGTTYHPGGWAMVGEYGRELVKLPRGSEVFSAGQTAAMAAAAPVTVNIGPVSVREDEDIQALAWRVVKEIERRR